jgi:hypothetical protein
MCLVAPTMAKVSSGTMITNSDWVYLEKFAFDDDGGSEVWLDVRANSGPHHAILLYNDNENEWPKVYESPLPCAERIEEVPGAYMQPLITGKWERFLYKVQPSVRQHFWYIAIANCGSTVNLDYEIVFKNSGGSHFSYDEQGLEALYITFSSFFLCGWPGLVYFIRKLRKRSLLSPILRLLILSYGLETVGCLCLLVHYVVYGKNGIGLNAVGTAGGVCHVVAQLFFVVGLCLLSNGWTISTQKLNNKRALSGIICLFICGHVGVGCWDLLRDKATTIYLYESPPGFVLIALHFVGLATCTVCLIRCHAFEHHSKAKRRFYRTVGALFLLWYLALPLQVLIAHFLSPWVRRKSVESLSMVFTFLGYLLIPALGNPKRAYELHGNTSGFSTVPSLKQMRQIVSVGDDFIDFSSQQAQGIELSDQTRNGTEGRVAVMTTLESNPGLATN